MGINNSPRVFFMNILFPFEFKDLCYGGRTTVKSELIVNVNSQWKGNPTNGLYLMGRRVEDVFGNEIFSGCQGEFKHNGITYYVSEEPYKDNPAITVTKYTFTTKK